MQEIPLISLHPTIIVHSPWRNPPTSISVNTSPPHRSQGQALCDGLLAQQLEKSTPALLHYYFHPPASPPTRLLRHSLRLPPSTNMATEEIDDERLTILISQKVHVLAHRPLLRDQWPYSAHPLPLLLLSHAGLLDLWD